MASKELMAWDSANKRWIKNAYLPGNRRKMVAVSARQLAKLYPDQVTAQTKDATREVANAWWEAKANDLGSDPLCEAIDRSIDQARIKNRKIDAALAVLERQESKSRKNSGPRFLLEQPMSRRARRSAMQIARSSTPI